LPTCTGTLFVVFMASKSLHLPTCTGTFFSILGCYTLGLKSRQNFRRISREYLHKIFDDLFGE
jgi:hypothetical protein